MRAVRKLPRLFATGLFGLVFVALVTGLFVRLGEATRVDPLCSSQTHYTIWGYINACTTTGWDAAVNASGIMDHTGALLVLCAATTLAAAALAGFGWPREGCWLGLAALFALIATVGLYSSGLIAYASLERTGLGLRWTWGWFVVLAAVPLLYAACLMAFIASRPIPPPPLDPGRKATFTVPPKGIRSPKQRHMRVLPGYEPKPRPEPEVPEAEPEPGATGEPDANWTTRLRSAKPRDSGKFKF